jgi:hypothetical protein
VKELQQGLYPRPYSIFRAVEREEVSKTPTPIGTLLRPSEIGGPQITPSSQSLKALWHNLIMNSYLYGDLNASHGYGFTLKHRDIKYFAE